MGGGVGWGWGLSGFWDKTSTSWGVETERKMILRGMQKGDVTIGGSCVLPHRGEVLSVMLGWVENYEYPLRSVD